MGSFSPIADPMSTVGLVPIVGVVMKVYQVRQVFTTFGNVLSSKEYRVPRWSRISYHCLGSGPIRPNFSVPIHLLVAGLRRPRTGGAIRRIGTGRHRRELRARYARNRVKSSFSQLKGCESSSRPSQQPEKRRRPLYMALLFGLQTPMLLNRPSGTNLGNQATPYPGPRVSSPYFSTAACSLFYSSPSQIMVSRVWLKSCPRRSRGGGSGPAVLLPRPLPTVQLLQRSLQRRICSHGYNFRPAIGPTASASSEGSLHTSNGCSCGLGISALGWEWPCVHSSTE
jgi:hypothetical protein